MSGTEIALIITAAAAFVVAIGGVYVNIRTMQPVKEAVKTLPAIHTAVNSNYQAMITNFEMQKALNEMLRGQISILNATALARAEAQAAPASLAMPIHPPEAAPAAPAAGPQQAATAKDPLFVEVVNPEPVPVVVHEKPNP